MPKISQPRTAIAVLVLSIWASRTEAMTFADPYAIVTSVAIYCEVDHASTQSVTVTREQLCAAAKLALADLASNKLNEKVIHRFAWKDAANPNWQQECIDKSRNHASAGSCDRILRQVVDDRLYFEISIIDKIESQHFGDVQRLILWFRVQEATNVACANGHSPATVSWRAVYEAPAPYNSGIHKYSDGFIERMRPRSVGLVCFDGEDNQFILTDYIEYLLAEWFSPFDINRLNTNGRLLNKYQISK